MIVVSDTTPIISLLKINRLDLLEKLYGMVIIPQAVYFELTDNEKYRNEAEIISDSNFIVRKDVNDINALKTFRDTMMLDLEESEAIILAHELKADVLLMDESKGRKAAANLNIPLSGTLGVLIDGFDAGVLSASEINESLEIMQKAKRRISSHLMQQVKDYMNK